jgi:hypothetical protein
VRWPIMNQLNGLVCKAAWCEVMTRAEFLVDARTVYMFEAALDTSLETSYYVLCTDVNLLYGV